MENVPLRIVCRYCEWSARVGGPWPDEETILAAAHSLKSNLIAHVATIHPDVHTPGPPALGAGVDRLLELAKKRTE